MPSRKWSKVLGVESHPVTRHEILALEDTRMSVWLFSMSDIALGDCNKKTIQWNVNNPDDTAPVKSFGQMSS